MEKQNLMNYKAKRIILLERRIEVLEKNKEHMLKEDKEWVENFEGVQKELQALKDALKLGMEKVIIIFKQKWEKGDGCFSEKGKHWYPLQLEDKKKILDIFNPLIK